MTPLDNLRRLAGALRKRLWGGQRERGKSLIIMLLAVLPMLLLLLGATYDLGNAATGVVIAQNAADLAAQEAGKLVDMMHFMEWAEVRLHPMAPMVAQQVADELTGGAFKVYNVYIVQDRFVVVEGEVTVRTPFLATFVGMRSVTRPVRGVAEAAYGIEEAR
jgi:hypothetical protein